MDAIVRPDRPFPGRGGEYPRDPPMPGAGKIGDGLRNRDGGMREIHGTGSDSGSPSGPDGALIIRVSLRRTSFPGRLLWQSDLKRPDESITTSFPPDGEGRTPS